VERSSRPTSTESPSLEARRQSNLSLRLFPIMKNDRCTLWETATLCAHRSGRSRVRSLADYSQPGWEGETRSTRTTWKYA
jgi:hypothetical protein